jgi:hypothetical protein
MVVQRERTGREEKMERERGGDGAGSARGRGERRSSVEEVAD